MPSPSRPRRPLEGGATTEWTPNQAGYRIFHRGDHAPTATFRRTWGPASAGRFDHHEPQDPPNHDRDGRSVLYLGTALRTCVLESGLYRDARALRRDGPRISQVCPEWRVAILEPRGGRPILQDLVDACGSLGEADDLGDGDHPRTATQEWARAIYEDLPTDHRASGIRYWSSQDRTPADQRSGVNRVIWDTSPEVRVRRPGRGEHGWEQYRLDHRAINRAVSGILAAEGVFLAPIDSAACRSC